MKIIRFLDFGPRGVLYVPDIEKDNEFLLFWCPPRRSARPKMCFTLNFTFKHYLIGIWWIPCSQLISRSVDCSGGSGNIVFPCHLCKLAVGGRSERSKVTFRGFPWKSCPGMTKLPPEAKVANRCPQGPQKKQVKKQVKHDFLEINHIEKASRKLKSKTIRHIGKFKSKSSR